MKNASIELEIFNVSTQRSLFDQGEIFGLTVRTIEHYFSLFIAQASSFKDHIKGKFSFP